MKEKNDYKHLVEADQPTNEKVQVGAVELTDDEVDEAVGGKAMLHLGDED